MWSTDPPGKGGIAPVFNMFFGDQFFVANVAAEVVCEKD
jgi:hypothetical protein